MTTINSNPWKGLKSYEEDDIIYGRDEDIEALYTRIIYNTQTVVYGRSGVGKSSLINAGIIKRAKLEGMLPVWIRLAHTTKAENNPTEPYIEQIKKRIEEELHKIGAYSEQVVQHDISHDETLWELLHSNRYWLPNGTDKQRLIPLLIFDQFEEIFTLEISSNRIKAFFDELADLLNEVKPDYIALQEQKIIDEPIAENNPVSDGTKHKNNIFANITSKNRANLPEYIDKSEFHIVITLRDDFLSYLERYTAFIPSMKHNRFGVLPLNEEQAAQIILRPVPGLVSKEVAKLIIEKVTDQTDFNIDDIPEIEVDAAVLSLYMNRLYEAKTGDSITSELVEKKGGEIIKDFYEDAIRRISDSTIDFLETELLNGQGRRENITIYDAIHQGHVGKSELEILCDEKKVLRKFFYSNELRIEFVHDILCPVVMAHKYERIRQKENEENRKKQEAENRKMREQEALMRHELYEAANKRVRMRRIISFIILGIVLIGLTLHICFKSPYSQYYAAFTTVNGWPEGIGEPLTGHLDIFEKQRISWLTRLKLNKEGKRGNYFAEIYKLTREGALPRKHYYSVTAVNSNGDKSTNLLVSLPVVGLMDAELNDEKAREFSKLQRKTVRWEYKGSADEVAICIALDINDTILYTIQYYRDNSFGQDSTYIQWAMFNDKNGRPMQVSDNRTDRMRQTVRHGIVTGCMFYTRQGVPQQNAEGAYGYSYDIDPRTLLKSKQYKVDKFGQRISNTDFDFYYDQFGRLDSTSIFKIRCPQKNLIVYQFDTFADTLQFNKNGTLGYGKFHMMGGEFSEISFKYDEQNRPLLNERHNNGILIEATRYTYGENGRIKKIEYYRNGETYEDRYEYPDSHTTIISTWQNGERYAPALRRINEYGDSITYHIKKETIYNDSCSTREFYGTDHRYAKQLVGVYVKDSTVKNMFNGLLSKQYFFNADGDIVKSSWFGYDEYGSQTVQAVAGIDGNPVRCQEWDWSHMCYYQMSYLRDNTNTTYIALEGQDEFGDDAYVVYKGNLFSIEPRPIEQLTVRRNSSTEQRGLYLAQGTFVPIEKSDTKTVPFLHLTKRSGQMYTARSLDSNDDKSNHPKDGDVIIRIGSWHLYQSDAALDNEWNALELHGGQIDVLRTDGQEYKKHSFQVNAGDLGAHKHIMPIKQSQQARIEKALH